ncbi:MAG: hypothetical protein OXU85_01650 [Thaumarchaeota archaeon]|nr:hypothetical protein [Nitrososphaerota archaeon]
METRRSAGISAMRQHNAILVAPCQHIDLKASIFISFVAIVPLAYAYGPLGNPVVLVPGLVFAAAYPPRIGIHHAGLQAAARGGRRPCGVKPV